MGHGTDGAGKADKAAGLAETGVGSEDNGVAFADTGTDIADVHVDGTDTSADTSPTEEADLSRTWELIREAHDNERPVKGLLEHKTRRGVLVDIMGAKAFLPDPHVALRRMPNVEDLIGQTLDLAIVKLNEERRKIIVSRRPVLKRERAKKRAALAKELLVGQVREGVVQNVTDFGAFVDLGGIDGLLHIRKMSWRRLSHPSDVVEVGATLDVKILDIDWDRGHISLGLKDLLPNPWIGAAKRFPVGARVRAKVATIGSKGAYLEVQPGVWGHVRAFDMSWTRALRHPAERMSEGDVTEAVVLAMDEEARKMSLGIKQLEEDPWLALPTKYPPGTRLQGTVGTLMNYGAFVEIEPGIDGLVHVSQMSWTKHLAHPADLLTIGSPIDVCVQEIDSDNRRMSLSIKELTEDPWPELAARFAVGRVMEGTVVRVREDGVWVDLGDDVEGFVAAGGVESEEGTIAAGVVGEVAAEPRAVKAPPGVGERMMVRVATVDVAERRIELEPMGAGLWPTPEKVGCGHGH